jgi:hypothetical protein
MKVGFFHNKPDFRFGAQGKVESSQLAEDEQEMIISALLSFFLLHFPPRRHCCQTGHIDRFHVAKR